MKIYYGVDRKTYANEVKYPMVSFRTMMKRKTPIVTDKEWFMDSGAFTFLKERGYFPFTYGKYLRAVARFKPTFWACMDWCCEPSVRQRTKHTVDTHISLTIENGIELIDFDRDSFIMVVQGWEREDYISCCEKIKEQGLITKVMGIGTICGRTDAKKVHDILKSIKSNLPNWVKIHCFGMSINLLKYKEIFDCIDSVDTYAWCSEFGLCTFSSNDEIKIATLKKYIEKVDALIDKNKKQSILELIGDD